MAYQEETYHVERVGNESQRMHRVADNQLQEEEGRVDAQQDHDTRRLGEPHLCGLEVRTAHSVQRGRERGR